MRVVYLFGAGATQAEVSYIGAANINVLMFDDEDGLGLGVSTRILDKLDAKYRAAFAADGGVDIEKLITLLVGSQVHSHSELAEEIRRLYFNEIRDGLASAKVLTNPRLALGLLTMHLNKAFSTKETLSGILTTNHDGLLQVAANQVYGKLNIGFPFRADEIMPAEAHVPPVVSLHGSFSWTFGLPIGLAPLDAGSVYKTDTVWIPPTTLKDSKHYPFNKLTGIAYELLARHCDVLRVVGSSLTQNDWNILSLLFAAQRHREHTGSSPFRIELIMPQKVGKEIRKQCTYLKNLTPIEHLTDGDFSDYKDGGTLTTDMKNPFAYWLKEKLQYHTRMGDFGSGKIGALLDEIAGDAS